MNKKHKKKDFAGTHDIHFKEISHTQITHIKRFHMHK